MFNYQPQGMNRRLMTPYDDPEEDEMGGVGPQAVRPMKKPDEQPAWHGMLGDAMAGGRRGGLIGAGANVGIGLAKKALAKKFTGAGAKFLLGFL